MILPNIVIKTNNLKFDRFQSKYQSNLLMKFIRLLIFNSVLAELNNRNLKFDLLTYNIYKLKFDKIRTSIKVA